MKKNKLYFVVGAGPSGLTASIKIKELNNDNQVILIDKNDSIGKKIKVSGNGKCNLANINTNIDLINNSTYCHELFQDGYQKINNFFSETLGILLFTDENGLVYPNSLTSETLISSYLEKISSLGISLKLEEEFLSFTSEINQILVKTTKDTYLVDYLVFATGGRTYYKNYNNNVIRELEKYSVKYEDFIPSLTGYLLKESVKELSKKRIKGTIKLTSNNEIIYSELGEIQFKDDGISGINVMNSSCYYAKLKDKSKCKLFIDFYPTLEKETLDLLIKKREINNFLKGSLPLEFYKYLIKNNKVLTLDILKNYPFTINGVYSFDYAQVSEGGIILNEINSNYSLKKVPNVFVLGELINASFICGGYNIMHAVLSALKMVENLK
ncbi:MAG: aminoacetone oxidase family FAD-binding enzyme [Acholeplasmatales bacterium]|jgi:predicted Rossmann fold flavoprotein|nr:aminoacetone oxidase family FAD-binding enzyme [Acholeplasmatales bacterium]